MVQTSPVGSFAANRYGLFDMGGNAEEWCKDWYDESEQLHVIRGAAWSHYGRDVMSSSYRDCDSPENYWETSGFRCVLGIRSP